MGYARPSAELPSVQLLRAVAALLVVVHHAGYDADTIAQHLGRAGPNLGFFEWTFGVDIFFVISGFIMIHTAADSFGRPGAPTRFLARRLIRIVPLYWLATSVLLIGAFLVPRMLNVPISGFTHVIASYLFIPTERAPGLVQPVLSQGWTLDYEMFFYLVFAGALLLPLRRGVAVLSATLLCLVLYGALAKPSQVQLRTWTSPLLLEFLLGMCVALAYRRGLRLKPAAALMLSLLGWAGAVTQAPWFTGQFFPNSTLIAAISAAAIMAGAALGPWPSRWRALLLLAALGDASYSLYLTHPFVIRPFREVWLRIGDRAPLGLYVLACCLVAAAFAVAVHAAVERPITQWLRLRMAKAASKAETADRTKEGMADSPSMPRPAMPP